MMRLFSLFFASLALNGLVLDITGNGLAGFLTMIFVVSFGIYLNEIVRTKGM